ncbi:hypothetical protein [Paenibacillus antarcticus]|uniref:Uncharacterized protein n=1 Tax=Paenibacillus antarcticus TaxID=253703 RepID=A0A168NGQ4_9BACL|nr:hypothetical protein [Paenibacillus antarcticus]OAB45784.1 hypothetical protein PBAT_12840 [Paenibacillus antarcticus]
MFHDLNVRLAEVKEKGRKYRKWDKRLVDLGLSLEQYEREANNWEQRLQREEQDVERMTGMSLFNLIYSVMGKKEEKIEREQLEVLEAKVKYDEALRTLKDTKDQIHDAQQQLSHVRGWEVEYDAIIRQKEQSLLHSNRELMELVDQQTDIRLTLKELKEAIQAGNSVMDSLKSASDGLQKARDWGTYDLLGGGMIATHIKHNNIDDAMSYIHDAQRELSLFSKELRDIQMTTLIEIDIGDFLRFSDYFFDGFISDWMVQGRINDTLDQVEGKANSIHEILQQLDNEYEKLDSELMTLNLHYTMILEQAE